MGSAFDLLDARSWPTDQSVSTTARANRMMLQDLMRAHGFRGLREEWWHFTLNEEPYPDRYFDFVVR
jgi:D-alanyl-D-alanine dipeptidase